jgi:hypothetical protein
MDSKKGTQRAKGRKVYSYLEESEAQKLEEIARKEVRTLNAQITKILRDFLETQEQSQGSED